MKSNGWIQKYLTLIDNASLIAEGVHQDFYENTHPPVNINKGTKTIKLFVRRLRNRSDLNES